MRIPIKEAVEVIAATLQTQINGTPGAWFQKLMFLDFWNRQRCFIFYQPMMYDYWCGVSSPFLNRRLARFCLSLPYHALVGRRLQKNVFRHYYPRLAEIPGDYGVLPMKLTFGFFTRHIREWNMKENTQEADCIRTSGRRALWPIDEVYSGLSEFFRMDALENLLKRVCEGGSPLWLKHWPIQTIAFRMLSEIEKHKIIG